MTIIKKESVDTGISQDSNNMIQPQNNTGFETCQDIQTIKEELARLKIEMDKYNLLALHEKDIKKSTEYYQKAHEKGIRYWAIRWVMQWSEAIPE